MIVVSVQPSGETERLARQYVRGGIPHRWRYGSPALKVLRWVVTAELVVFVGAAIAASVAHA